MNNDVDPTPEASTMRSAHFDAARALKRSALTVVPIALLLTGCVIASPEPAATVTVTATPEPVAKAPSPEPVKAPPVVAAPTATTEPAPKPEPEPESEPEPEQTMVMPALVGMNLQLAQDTLQSMDSFLLDQEDASGLDRLQIDDSNWTVCTQDPAAGVTVSVDAMITLGSVKLGEVCPG